MRVPPKRLRGGLHSAFVQHAAGPSANEGQRLQGSTKSFETQGGGGLRGIKRSSSAFNCRQPMDSIAWVRSRANAFFAEEFQRPQSFTFQTYFAGKYFARIVRLSLTYQYQCHVSKRSEIAAGSDAAARGDDRGDLVVQQVADSFATKGVCRRGLSRGRWPGSASCRERLRQTVEGLRRSNEDRIRLTCIASISDSSRRMLATDLLRY